MTNARSILDLEVTERELQNTIVKMARNQGWFVYHTWNSKHSEAGFPDLTMVHPTRHGAPLIFAELKRQDKDPSVAQQAWLDAICDTMGLLVGDYVIAEVWRPSDLDRIEALLSGQANERMAS